MWISMWTYENYISKHNKAHQEDIIILNIYVSNST